MKRRRPEGPITLELIYDAIMTLTDELDEQKAQWQEAEQTLIERMELRDTTYRELERRVTALERAND